MKEKEFEYILNRNEALDIIQKNFKYKSELLQEIVNYGTNLIPRAFISSKKSFEDTFIIGFYLKQAVTLIDAIEVLISNSCVYPAFNLVRSLFEVKLYFQWILKDKTSSKIRQLYVSNVRNNNFWLKVSTEGTKENKDFGHVLNNINNKDIIKKKDIIEEQIKINDQLLNNHKYKTINKSFEDYKTKNKIKHEPRWYQPNNGPQSIKKIASELDLLEEYDLLYHYFSKYSHGIDFEKSIKLSKGKVEFELLRNPKDINFICSYTVTTALIIYRQILSKYRYSELENFNKKYLNEWRKRHLSTTEIEFDFEIHQI